MTDLLELAARCEAATGPDKALDVAIWLAVLADDASLKAYRDGLKVSKKEAAFRADYMMDGKRYTASIDAAMTLVPDDCLWSVGHVGDDAPGQFGATVMPMGPDRHGRAISAALALCAAALRARSEAAAVGGR